MIEEVLDEDFLKLVEIYVVFFLYVWVVDELVCMKVKDGMILLVVCWLSLYGIRVLFGFFIVRIVVDEVEVIIVVVYLC